MMDRLNAGDSCGYTTMTPGGIRGISGSGGSGKPEDKGLARDPREMEKYSRDYQDDGNSIISLVPIVSSI